MSGTFRGRNACAHLVVAALRRNSQDAMSGLDASESAVQRACLVAEKVV